LRLTTDARISETAQYLRRQGLRSRRHLAQIMLHRHGPGYAYEALELHNMTATIANELDESTVPVTIPISVVTRMMFAASPAQVWQGLVFYEEIPERPPLHLRLLLPVPIGTEGRISKVGDEVNCLYEGGHLVKRVTRIEHEELYAFEVAEQALSVGGGMRLSGGRYALRELADDRTEVALETRYVSTRWPRWFWKPLEGLVCHSFHRCLLSSMRRQIESQ